MNVTSRFWLLALFLLTCAGAQAQQSGMTFFVTSTGVGKGADLGGLEGADRKSVV